jgi:hypothetical protein
VSGGNSDGKGDVMAILKGEIEKVEEGKKGERGVSFSLVSSEKPGGVFCVGRIVAPSFDLRSGQRVSIQGAWVAQLDGSQGHFRVEAIEQDA